MEEKNLFQGRDPQKVAEDHEYVAKCVRFAIPIIILMGALGYIFG